MPISTVLSVTVYGRRSHRRTFSGVTVGKFYDYHLVFFAVLKSSVISRALPRKAGVNLQCSKEITKAVPCPPVELFISVVQSRF